VFPTQGGDVGGVGEHGIDRDAGNLHRLTRHAQSLEMDTVVVPGHEVALDTSAEPEPMDVEVGDHHSLVRFDPTLALLMRQDLGREEMCVADDVGLELFHEADEGPRVEPIDRKTESIGGGRAPA